MLRRTRSALSAALVALLLPHAAFAACITRAEAEAGALRSFQVGLQVAALSCPGSAHRDAYNAYMRRHKTGLAASVARFQGFFARASGGSGQVALDRFTTRVANAASQRMVGQPDFCVRIVSVMAEAAQADAAGLADLSRRYAGPMVAGLAPACRSERPG